MKSLKAVIKFMPFLMLIGDGISILLVHEEWFPKYVLYFSDTLGHSIFTGLFMLFFAYRFRFCLYTKLTIYSLLAFNIVNFIDSLVPLKDYMIYMTIIVLYGIINGIILTINHAVQPNTPNNAGRVL